MEEPKEPEITSIETEGTAVCTNCDILFDTTELVKLEDGLQLCTACKEVYTNVTMAKLANPNIVFGV